MKQLIFLGRMPKIAHISRKPHRMNRSTFATSEWKPRGLRWRMNRIGMMAKHRLSATSLLHKQHLLPSGKRLPLRNLHGGCAMDTDKPNEGLNGNEPDL